MAEDKFVSDALMKLTEKMGANEQVARAAHTRLDRIEQNIREDFAKIIENDAKIYEEINGLKEYMNRGKGWAAAANLLVGLFGGVIVAGVIYLIKHGG